MSQAKVDKYKKEKKNRAKTIKRKKIRAAAGFLILCLGIGLIIGYPLGKKIYKDYAAERAANATVESAMLHYSVQKYWAENYSGMYSFPKPSTSTDTDAEAGTEEAASDTDAPVTAE